MSASGEDSREMSADRRPELIGYYWGAAACLM